MDSPSPHRMIDRLVANQTLRTPRIEQAFREIPRDHFLPGVPNEEVYRGGHVVTKRQSEAVPGHFKEPDRSPAELGRSSKALSSSTGPWLMAGMLEQLQPVPGERILEIGAGTGYNAAILAKLVGEQGFVATLEIDEDVADQARRRLARFGLGETSKAGYSPVTTHAHDGALGWPGGAPWDAILVTVRSGQVTRQWFEQLRPGGRLVVPLELGGARAGEMSVSFVEQDGRLESTSLIDCGFIRPRGGLALSGREIQLGDPPGLLWNDGARHPLGATEILKLLEGPSDPQETGLETSLADLISGFQIWLAIHDPDNCTLKASGPWLDWPALRPMMHLEGRLKAAGGLFDGRGIALLALECGADQPKPTRTPNRQPRPLVIVSYGDESAAVKLAGHVHAWHAAGRPSRDRLRLRFYPGGYAAPPSEDQSRRCRLPQPWGELEADWPDS